MQCKYCKKEFGKRQNSEICYECMPAGLSNSERNKVRKILERKHNPVFSNCPSCEKKFEVPCGEVNRKYCFECMPSGISKQEQTNRVRYLAKAKMIRLLGGKCRICSYHKYQSALDFHHMDEGTKEFNIANRISSCDFNKEMLYELGKCVLLCSNCHRALHANEITGIKLFDK